MTITTVLKLKTPQTPDAIQGYQTPPETAAHIKATYEDTGLMTNGPAVISDGGLTKTSTITFKDDAAKAKFTSDPVVIANGQAMTAYNQAQGIVHLVNGV
jgi:uncharacterized protein YciI